MVAAVFSKWKCGFRAILPVKLKSPGPSSSNPLSGVAASREIEFQPIKALLVLPRPD